MSRVEGWWGITMGMESGVHNSGKQIAAIIAIAVSASVIIVAIMAFALNAQSSHVKQEQGQNAAQEGGAVSADAPVENVELTTYRTKLYEEMNEPGPVFTFQFPDNWKVTQEDCSPEGWSEHVVLASDGGKTIDFLFGNAIANSSGEVADEQLAQADFNAEPYPDLEKPAAADEFYWKGASWPNSSDEEIGNLSLSVNRWERSEQVLGLMTGYCLVNAESPEETFWYYGPVEFWCMDSPGTFTEDEEREVVQILSSLRQEPADVQVAEGAAEQVSAQGDGAAALQAQREKIVGSWSNAGSGGGMMAILGGVDVSDDGTAHRYETGLPSAEFTWEALEDGTYAFTFVSTKSEPQSFFDQSGVYIDANDQLHWGDQVFSRT